MNSFKWISWLGKPHIEGISYKFLFLGHPTRQQFHMNFFTWDTPQMNSFKWISLPGKPRAEGISYEFLSIGHLYIKKNIYEFLFLGHSTRQRFHMNFLTWETPHRRIFIWIPLLKKKHMNFSSWGTLQGNNFIWISLLGTPHKWTVSNEFLYLGNPAQKEFHMNFFL